MFSAALITVSLIVGYVVVASLTMFATFAVTRFIPNLAVKNHRLTNPYNLLQDLFWLLFSALGGYVAVAGSAEASPHLTAAALAGILLIVIWSNREETRQRGLIHMLITSVCIVIGIAAAYALRMKQIQVN